MRRAGREPTTPERTVDFDSMLAEMKGAARASVAGDAVRELITRAQVRGIAAPPAHSRGHIRDAHDAELARRAAMAKRGRGLRIVMLGPLSDPMQRPGTEPVYRGVKEQWKGPSASQALPQASSRRAAPAVPAPPPPPAADKSVPARVSSTTASKIVLKTKDGDILEEVEDEPTPCYRCEGKGYVVDDLREHHRCAMCDALGVLGVE